jgi:predicted nucleic acid-binding protein
VKSFVDTNVLVYAYAYDHPEHAVVGLKNVIARDLVVSLWETRRGVVSVQVLQELYVTLTRKGKPPLDPEQAHRVVREYLAWEVVENTPELLVAAIELQRDAQLSLWDAMIIRAALDVGCSELYTEDLNAGQRFGPLLVVNPFTLG